MINKELVELQKGCQATSVVIQNKDCEELEAKKIIDASLNSRELLAIMKEISQKKDEIDYLIITEIDQLDENLQNRYYQIVKDREFQGCLLPKDMIIVFTVKDKEGLKNISQELYHFCVVAF